MLAFFPPHEIFHIYIYSFMPPPLGGKKDILVMTGKKQEIGSAIGQGAQAALKAAGECISVTPFLSEDMPPYVSPSAARL